MTAEQPSSRVIESAQDLLAVVELDGIEVYEVSGRGIDRGSVDDYEETYDIKVAVNVSPEYLKTRFTMTFNAAVGEYRVDLAVRYRIEEQGLQIPPAATVDFAERVGVMAAFPFLRENIYNIASRLGDPIPVLGLVRQGQFKLEMDPAVVAQAASDASAASPQRE